MQACQMKDDRQIAAESRHNFHFLSHFKVNSYWTEVHQIFTQCKAISAAIDACLYSLYFVSECKSKE